MKQAKKMLICVCVALVLATAVEIFAWAISSPVVPVLVPPSDHEELYPGIEYYTSGYDVDGSSFVPTNDDPQIGFYIAEWSINVAVLEFGEPLDSDITVQVYYATNNEALSGSNFVDVVAKKGSNSVSIELAAESYTHLRFDINGAFTLESIYVSTTAPTTQFVKEQPNILRIFVTWFVLVPLTCAIYFIYKKKDAAIGFVSRGIQCASTHKRKLIIVVLAAVIVLLMLQVNNSSLRSYDAIVPNNIAETDMVTLGVPRPIRSDEYLTGTAQLFHGSNVGKLSLLWENCDSALEAANNVISMLNPFFFGELYLPAEYALSWNFLFQLVVYLFFFYKLFCILTSNKAFSAIASLILYFSPGLQWWWGADGFGTLCGIVVLFYDFFVVDKTYKKVICAYGLVCLTSTFVESIYPAWDVPTVYFSLFLLVGIYLRDKRINFVWRDVAYIIPTCALMIVIVVAYFVTNAEDNALRLATVYPGRRLSSGGDLQPIYWANYLAAPFTTWKPFSIANTNQSEFSSFIHLFPIPLVLYFVKYKCFRERKVITALFLFNIVCMIYMISGIGDTIAKYTLLSYTTSARIFTVWGYSMFIMLLLECYFIAPPSNGLRNLSKRNILECAILNVVIAVFVAWVAVSQRALVDYIGSVAFCYVAIGVFALGNMALFGAKRLFIGLMCAITIISGVVVNPINVGSAALGDTRLANAIEEIDSSNPGKWLALNNIILPKYVYAQGVDCINYLNWPPKFELFEPFDINGEYQDIYNRFAHMTVFLTEGRTSFELVQADYFIVNLNFDDLEKWDVQYVVLQGQPLESTENVLFDLVYHDELDNVFVYEATYLTDG